VAAKFQLAMDFNQIITHLYVGPCPKVPGDHYPQKLGVTAVLNLQTADDERSETTFVI